MKQLCVALLIIYLISPIFCDQVGVSSSFTSNDFSNTDGWTVTYPHSGNLITQCGSNRMLGGFGVFGVNSSATKQFINLPPHYQATIKLRFYKIDSWDNEAFWVTADGNLVWQTSRSYASGSQICGQGHANWNEEEINVEVTFSHSSANLVVILTSTLNQAANDESWGFNNFYLFITTCDPKCQTCLNDQVAQCEGLTFVTSSWMADGVNAEGWTAIKAKNVGSSNCGGVNIFGGYNMFGAGTSISRTFDNMKEHTSLWIKLQFWKIDSWDGEKAIVIVDGKTVWEVVMVWNQGSFYSICGVDVPAWREGIYDITVEVPHTSPSATIQVTTSLDQDAADESWGVREFQLFMRNNGITDKLAVSDFTTNDFTDTQGWGVIGAYSNPVVTQCGSVKLLGGYNVLGKGSALHKIVGLPPHYALKVEFKLFKIDSWDNQVFYLFLDGVNKYQKGYHYTTGTQQCGVDHVHYQEQLEQISIVAPHKMTNLVITMTTNLDEAANNESWGIRDFQIFVYTCAANCVICDSSSPDGCSVWTKFQFNYVTNDPSFGNEGWAVQGTNPAITQCSGIYLFGGFNAFGNGVTITKTFASLPQHKGMNIKMQFWKLDSWDNEWAYMNADGNRIWQQQYAVQTGFPANICGAGVAGWLDQITDVDVSFAHDANDVTLLIGSTLNQGAADESWGIRDLEIYLENGTLQDDDDKNMSNPNWWYTCWAENTFTTLDDWTATNVYSQPLITSCGPYRMVGGFNVFGQNSALVKSFTMPPHYQMTIRLKLFKIDSWDNEQFQIFVDGVNVYSKALVYSQGSQICGQAHANWHEQMEVIEVTFEHTNVDAVIVLASTLNQAANDESWGVKNFRIGLTKCPDNCALCNKASLSTCSTWKLAQQNFMNPTSSAEGWQVKGATNSATNCAGVSIFGGFNVFGAGASLTKQFSNLPTHNTIRVRLQFWKIDSWDNEQAQMYVDGILIWAQNFQVVTGFPANVCGQGHNNWNEQIVDVDVTLDSSNTAPTIFITTTINQGAADESWGVRDFQLFTGQTQPVVDKGADDPNIYYKAFQGNTFEDLDGWSVQNAYSEPYISSCAGVRMVGGFNIFGKSSAMVKEMPLPPHYQVTIRFVLFKIDSWDGEQFLTYIDGVQAWNPKLAASTGQQVCGQGHNNWNEQAIDVEITVDHSAPSVTMMLTSTLDQAAADESWGIRNFQLIIAKCPTDCSICTKDTAGKADLCNDWKLVGQDFVNASQDTWEGWQVQNAKPQFTVCSGVKMFGGFNVFGKGAVITKTYVNLPAHNKIIVRAQFWKIDSWDGEQATLSLDGVPIWQQKLGGGFASTICGQQHAGWTENVIDIAVLDDHAVNTATLQFSTTLDQGAADESWGVRDIQILVETLQQIKPDESLQNSKFYSAFADNAFTAAPGWVTVGQENNNVYTSCDGTRLYGGYRVFGQGSSATLFLELPSHFQVTIQFTLYKIDSWDNEVFLMYVDGKQVYDQKFVHSEGINKCGADPSNWKDQVEQVKVSLAHNQPNLEVMLTSTLNQGAADESWGIRDFYVFIEKCPENCQLCTQSTLSTCQNTKLVSSSWVQNDSAQTADGWTVSNADAKGTSCAGIQIFGGYGVFGKGATVSKVFSSIPTHNKLVVRFQFWKLDSWDNEQAQLIVDGVQQWGQNISWNMGFKSNVCGRSETNWNEFIVDVQVTIDHTNPTANIVFTSTLNQGANDESWGIRNFELYYPVIPEPPKPDSFYAAFYSNSFNDSEGWAVVNNYQDQLVSSCGNIRVLGGYKVFGAQSTMVKQFVLPSHYLLNVKFNLLKIDSWDNEQMLVYVDGTQAYNKQLGLKDGEQMCGTQHDLYVEAYIAVALSVQHNSPTATIAITSTLNENASNESWGIRDFTLDFAACPENCKYCNWDTREAPEVCDNWTVAASSLTQTQSDKLDIQNWTVSGGALRQVTTCAGVSILGGYGVFGKGAAAQSTFTKLPTHNTAKVKLQFWKIDTWDNEWLYVFVDDALAYQQQFHYTTGFHSSVCGHATKQYTEAIVDIEFDVNHTADSLTLKLTSSLNENADNESWGFRDVVVLTEEVTPNTPTKPKNPPFYEAFMTNEFTGLDSWDAQNAESTQLITACGSDRIYGGFGVFGAKAVVTKQLQLPPHSSLAIKFKLYKIDSWDDHVFWTYVDGVQVIQQKYQFNQGSDICGHDIHTQWKDQISYVEIPAIPHTAPTVFITMGSTLDQTASDESWGIKEFQIWITPCPDGCTTCAPTDKAADCNLWKMVDSAFISDSQLDGWQAFVSLPKFTDCGSASLFGGYGVFGAKAYIEKVVSDLPLHNQLRLKMQFWKIDTWDNEWAQILVDGVVVWQQQFTNAKNILTSVCGNANPDDIVDVEVDVDHSNSSANIVVRTSINQGAKDESWGVRNYQLFVENASTASTKTDKSAFYTAFTTQTFTSTDGWLVSGAYNEQVITSCDGMRLLGGYRVLGKGSSLFKEIALPPHYQVQMKFNLVKIDSWDNEAFLLYVDGTNVMKKAFTVSQGIQACGSEITNWNDAIESVDVTVAHTMPTLLITMQSTLNENADNESWGIRDFQLILSNCPSNCKVCAKDNLDTCSAWNLVESDWVDPSKLTPEGWTVTGAQPGTTTCSGVDIFGGYGLFGKGASIQKQFQLPTHNSVMIQFQFWKIDSWDNEWAQLYLDGVLIWTRQFAGGFASDICGNANHAWVEQIFDVVVLADHTNPNPTLLLTSTVNQGPNDESWGLRDFSILTYNEQEATNSKPDPKAFASDFFGNSFTDPDGWLITQQYGNKQTDNANPFTSCGGTRLFGGYRTLGYGNVVTKQFTLPPHSQVALSFKLFKIDSWDNEVFFVYADSALLTTKQYPYNQGSQQCGNTNANWNEHVELVQSAFVHNFPTITVIMTSSLNEAADNESWGFREFQIALEGCPDGCSLCTAGQAAGQCSVWKLFSESWTQSSGLTLEGWVPQGNFNPSSTNCAGVNLLGGFGQFGAGATLQKVFFNMPPHTQVYVMFQVWAVDSWDNERFSLLVDGVEAWGQNFQYTKGVFRDMCGAGWADQLADGQATFAHSLYTMTLEFRSTINQNANDESWGVRQFQLFTDIVDASADPNKPVYQAFTKATIDQSELKGWVVTNPKQTNNMVTQCGGDQIFGGHNVFGAGTSAVLNTALNPHYELTITLNLFKIDSWDEEQFLLFVDGAQVFDQSFSLYDGTQQCGRGGDIFLDQKQFIQVTVPHNKPSVSIMMTSTLNQDANDESWGFRDFTLTMRACPAGCVVCDNDNSSECLIWQNQEADWSIQNFNADGWEVVSGASQTSVCVGNQLFGGFNVFGANTYIKKTFSSLPVHQKLRIQVQFWKIDSWDDERASLLVNGQEVWSLNFHLYAGYSQQLCGVGGWKDAIVDIDVTVLNSDTAVEVEFRTTLDQGAGDESWGVRDFYLYLGHCAEGCFDCVGNRKQDCLVPNTPSLYYSAFSGSDWPNSDMEGWNVLSSYNKNSQVTTCKQYRIFGGYGVLGANSALTSVIQLPPHYLVRVQFNFYKIDSWDNEAFYIYLDGLASYRAVYQYTSGQQLCGNQNANWNELILPIDITMEHNAATLVVVMQTTLNEAANNESWGISDFKLLIEQCPKGCVTCSNQYPSSCLLWNTLDNSWDTNGLLTLNGWLIQGAKGNQYSSNCGGVNMIGGYNIFGKNAAIKKTISNLPKHSMVMIKMQVWKLDSWDYERIDLNVDGFNVWQDNLNYWGGYHNVLCGVANTSWNEQTIDVDIAIPHTSGDITIIVSTTLNQDASDESWGIRQVDIYSALCPNNCITCLSKEVDTCLSCTQPYILQSGKCVQAPQQLIVESDFVPKQFNSIEGWIVENKKGSVYTSQCGGVTMIGGYDIFGKGALAKKTFQLSQHKTLRIQVQFWKIDSWDNEELFILVDGSKVWERHFGFQSYFTANTQIADQVYQQCGQEHLAWNEQVVNIDFTIEHSAATATVLISSTLNEDASNESWGFREFYLSIESTEECAFFYSECNYQGDYVEYCREARNSLKTNFLPQIKSFKIPPNGKVNVYQTQNFEVKTVELTDSDECVDDDQQLSLTQKTNKL